MLKVWQPPTERDVFQEKSEKRIRQKFELILTDEQQNIPNEIEPKL